MNKLNIVILSFLTIAYSQIHGMDGLEVSRPTQTDLYVKVMDSFKLVNNIKNRFLRLKDFAINTNEDAKISQITDLLNSYQKAHESFIHSRFSCNPENLLPKYLQKYCFCNPSIQDQFQAKADYLLGGYVLDLHQWFEEMRSAECQALLVPHRLITG